MLRTYKVAATAWTCLVLASVFMFNYKQCVDFLYLACEHMQQDAWIYIPFVRHRNNPDLRRNITSLH